MTDTERLIKLLQNPEVKEAIITIIQDAICKTDIRLVADPPITDPSFAGKIAERVMSHQKCPPGV